MNYKKILSSLFHSNKSTLDNTPLSKTVLLSHLLILIGVSVTVFSNNKLALFQGIDGAYYQILLKYMHEWMPFQFFLPYNPLQGNGNIIFAINLPILPSQLISYLFTGSATPVVIYTVVAVELFLSTVFLGYCFKLKPPVVMLAAWLLPLISLPFYRFSIIYGVTVLTPYVMEQASLIALIIGGFYLLGKQSVFHSVFWGGLVIGTFFYTNIASPALIILIVPLLLTFGLISLLTSSKAERHTKIIFILVSLLMFLPGLLPFLAGIFLNTAPAFFSSEMYNDRGNLHYVSLLFHSDYGPYLVSFSLVGSVLASLVAKRHAKILAIATLLCTLIILLPGLVLQRFGENYRGPSILYVEFFLWQFYCIFAAFAVVYPLGFVKGLIVKMTGRRYFQFLPMSLPRLYLLVLILPMVIVRDSYFYPAGGGQWQTQKTAMVQKLEQEIAISPGSEYRGIVATFTGYNNVPSIIWFNQHSYDGQLMGQIGNEHRAVGLWKYNIPTLIEYSPLITPSFYLMASRLLARATDQQMRNIMVYSNPNLNYLKNLGVRFLITDFPMAGGALKDTLTAPQGISLYLYELDQPNLGNYSPVKFYAADNAAGTLKYLSANSFDFQQEVVVEQAISTKLVKPASSKMFVERQGMRVMAQTEGVSLIVLPLEFSHCLQLPVPASDSITLSPRLLRVNLSQTGLLFAGTIDAQIQFAYGPFHNPMCRIQDYLDMKRLRIAELRSH
jgi:hypothetical protein